MEKPIVFISHIFEEREIATALKALLESCFIGLMEVFVSSDPDSISPGQKWLDRISFGLKKCSIEVVVASKVSVRRQWVNFEAGAGWVRDIPVIPICHSGMTHDTLPPPLNSLQAADATDENQLRNILPVFAKKLGSDIPKADFSTFISVVKNYQETTAKNIEVTQKLLIPEKSGLAEHERVTLEEIAELVDSPNERINTVRVKSECEKRRLRKFTVNLATKMLERKGLVELTAEEDQYNSYQFVRITDEGWAWLEINHEHLLLYLPYPGKPEPDEEEVKYPNDEVPF